MRIAVVGSRGLTVENLAAWLPTGTTQIISGGARGVDACARAYAAAHDIPCVEFLPDYKRYGRSAPLRRNRQIVRQADLVIAFWDGSSRGTKHTIQCCLQENVPLLVLLCR
ncbi:MAG: DUF2493 domain-containing protein [Clostridia bacterium]|nr:DUF2493 domain-containing protein [Clostridia bacterium]